MKIVVTGAAGFIGSNLAERLVLLGHAVTAIDAFTKYYDNRLKEMNAADLAALGVKIHRQDLADGNLADALAGAEIICHLAAQPGISSTTPFEHYLRNNVWATYYLAAEAMKLKTLKLFINIATSSIYGKQATDAEDAPPQPTSHYGVTKLAAEQLVLSYQRDKNFPATSLRLFSVYGPRERPEKLYPLLIQALATDAPFPLFEGSQAHSRSFTYVGDIVDGIIAAMQRPERCIGETINLGCETEITTGRGIEIVENIFGKKVRIESRPRRAGDQLHTHANIAKAKKLLDYNPATSPEKGLALQVEWFMSKLYADKAAPGKSSLIR